jgi:hypothetical protein
MHVAWQVSVHHIHPINSPPVKVVIVGNTPELGDWDVNKAVTLESDPVSRIHSRIRICMRW